MTMMVMIQGLNPQFELLQQQLFLSPKLSLEDCRGAIMEQCERICIQQSVPTTTANKADVSTHHTSPKCVHCGRFNHISDDCWLKTSNKGSHDSQSEIIHLSLKALENHRLHLPHGMQRLTLVNSPFLVRLLHQALLHSN